MRTAWHLLGPVVRKSTTRMTERYGWLTHESRLRTPTIQCRSPLLAWFWTRRPGLRGSGRRGPLEAGTTRRTWWPPCRPGTGSPWRPSSTGTAPTCCGCCDGSSAPTRTWRISCKRCSRACSAASTRCTTRMPCADGSRRLRCSWLASASGGESDGGGRAIRGWLVRGRACFAALRHRADPIARGIIAL